MLGSFLGPMAVSLSLPATALLGGDQAGRREGRYRTVLVAGTAAVLTGALASVAAQIGEVIPAVLLTTFAGLAVLDILIDALGQATVEPLVIGPVVAFTITLSDLSLLGFGPFFWALALGSLMSHLLEREDLEKLADPSIS